MATKSNHLFKFIYYAVYIGFIGVSIKTAVIIFALIQSLILNPIAAKDMYRGLDLYQLLSVSQAQYFAMASLLIFSYALKAKILHLVIKILEKINFQHPFTKDISDMIAQISYVAFGIGLTNLIAKQYHKWLNTRGVELYSLPDFLSGSSEFLFMAGLVFIIAKIFQKGIELQTEQDLTI